MPKLLQLFLAKGIIWLNPDILIQPGHILCTIIQTNGFFLLYFTNFAHLFYGNKLLNY